MSANLSRRSFLTRSATVGAAVSLVDLAFLDQLPAFAAGPPTLVPLDAELEPLVRLIEDTPQNKVLEKVGQRIKEGTAYQQLLGALLLAGVRGIQPRPVGFKFHAVLVVHSAHQATLAAKDQDRWLPIFWAIDNYKKSQKANKEQGDWHMAPVDEAKVPKADAARRRFVEAMDNWDVDGADVAVAGLARNCGAIEIQELFWRYGARDFRDIGHKAIFVANAFRTLNTIGWKHSEPVLRSLAYALLEHEEGNPAKRNDERDVVGRDNLKRAAKVREGWTQGKPSSEATLAILDAVRSDEPGEVSDKVVALLNKEVAPASIWDGLFLAGGELLMRQPGIVGLHTLTTLNALHHAHTTSGNDETRRFVMLQGAAFLTLFRKAMVARGKLADGRIDKLEKEELKSDTGAVAEIFRDVGKDKMTAARKTLALLDRKSPPTEALMQEARRLIFVKGTDSHDYKFSSAILEDTGHLSPEWRARFLASAMFQLRGLAGKDNDLVERTRAALEG